jgi:hypothetical protein
VKTLDERWRQVQQGMARAAGGETAMCACPGCRGVDPSTFIACMVCGVGMVEYISRPEPGEGLKK